MNSQEQDIFKAVIISAAVVAIPMLYFLWAAIRCQRRFRALSNARIQAEITSIENERRRIATDLHDEMGPLLSAVKLHINHMEGHNEDETEIIRKSSAHIDDVIQRMREMSNDLLPSLLIQKGLASAIRDFIGKWKAAPGLQIHFDYDSTLRLQTPMEVNLYRMTREIIHNTIKHASARNLNISLHIDAYRVTLSAQDDGIGFDYSGKRRMEAGLGLLNLQSRTEVMGGKFIFNSVKGKGTKYFFEIPLQPL